MINKNYMRSGYNILFKYLRITKKEGSQSIAQAAYETGLPEHVVSKLKKQATLDGLVTGRKATLTKLGEVVSEYGENDETVRDLLDGKVTKYTAPVFCYILRNGNVSTKEIPATAKELGLRTFQLEALLKFADAKELIGISQIADLNNVTFRDITAGEVLEAVLKIKDSE